MVYFICDRSCTRFGGGALANSISYILFERGWSFIPSRVCSAFIVCARSPIGASSVISIIALAAIIIDLEVRIYEGKQAIVSSVTVKGNTKTHDNVILREIRTKPGQLFNRADIIRTQRELAQLQYFDPQKLNVNPKPNPAEGTVDIEYIVEETSSDQIEMSLGWGMGALIGTVGVSFNNFSLKGVGDKKAWRPINCIIGSIIYYF